VNKFHSLSQSLTYRIMAVVLVMMVVITCIVYFYVKEYMVDEAEERYEGVLQRDHEEFRRKLSIVAIATRNYREEIEHDIDNPEKTLQKLNRFLQINSRIITCGVLYQPGNFPDRQRCLELVASHDTARAIHLRTIENDYSPYIDRHWFKEGIANDTAHWSEVYFEEGLIPGITGRRQLTTYCLPVHNKEGKPVAVFGADVLLENLRSELLDDLQDKIEKYERGSKHHSYNFVIDHDGTYILHPDDNRILNANFYEEAKRSANKIDDQVVASMMNGENGSAMVEIDGIPSWIYYRTVKRMDWRIAIVVPQEVISRNSRMLNTIILIVVLIGLVAIYFICQRMMHRTTQPLNRLAHSAREVAKGNFQSHLPDVKDNNEVRVLHDAFVDMQHSLADYVEQLQKTTSEKASIDQELKIANGIQMALVPKSFPERSDVSLYAFMNPALEVGGDLYDYYFNDNWLYFCIGDVSGKGVPAALVMAVTRTLFHSISMAEDKPERIVWRINRAVCESSDGSMFVTMFVGILNLTTGHLDYCNAGHETPLLSGQPLPVKRNKPVGALSDWNFEGQEAQLQPGDLLFLYTDGLSEARNQAGKQLGRATVAELVKQQACETPRQQVEEMAQEVYRYAANAAQSDDITMLAIKWQKQGLTLHASMDETERLKPFITDVATQAGIAPKEIKRFRAAVEEAVVNIINYGQATTITLQTRQDDGQLLVTIDDDGLPFDPTQGSATDLSIPTDQRPPGGMGILMIQRMTDGQSYQRTDGHNILTLTKKI
jgi:sigma-B regulation protein RsbU (phosphoserine phosphatase)